MTDSVAQDQIKAFVDRILRLKEEVREINRDIREIYAEAKGNGFDKTVLGKVVNYVEKRANDASALQESDALFDLYLTAYDGRPSRAHAHEAGERLISAAREMRQSITEPQSAPQAAQSQGPKVPVSSPDRREGDDDGQPIQPETANEAAGTRSVPSMRAKAPPAPVQEPPEQQCDTLGVTGGESAASKIIEGMTEALAVARGEAEPAAVYTFTPKPHDGPFSSSGLPRPKAASM